MLDYFVIERGKMSLLELRSIFHSFGHRTVLRNISLKIEKGHFVCFLGPSGSGKSTLLRIIAGLLKPTSGQVFINSIDQSKISTHKREIGFVFQSPTALFPHRNVFDNIAFPFKVGKRQLNNENWKTEVNRLLSLIGLQAHANSGIANLSGGELQRVALARALVYHPDLLLLDEPLSSLDNILKKSMLELMQRLKKEYNTTFIYVTHDEREALRIATHIAILHDANIQQFGSVESILKKPKTREVAEIIGGWNILKNKTGVTFGIPITQCSYKLKISNPLPQEEYQKVRILSNRIWHRSRRLTCMTHDEQLLFCDTDIDAHVQEETEGYIFFKKEDIHVFEN